MELFTNPELWIAFLTLLVLEIILGIDNVVFISILAAKLPERQRKKARTLGLSLALVMRIGLLFSRDLDHRAHGQPVRGVRAGDIGTRSDPDPGRWIPAGQSDL